MWPIKYSRSGMSFLTLGYKRLSLLYVLFRSLYLSLPYPHSIPYPILQPYHFLWRKQTAMLRAALCRGTYVGNIEAFSQQPVRNWGLPTSTWVDGDLTGTVSLLPTPSPNFSNLLVEGISLWPHRDEKSLCIYLKLRGSHAEEIILFFVEAKYKEVHLEAMRMR